MNRERTQQGLADYIQQRIDDGQRPQVCGGNGGDGAWVNKVVGFELLTNTNFEF